MPKLREVLPQEFMGCEFDDIPARRYAEYEILEEFDGTLVRWVGLQKYVYTWYALENGIAVGWNENPSKGWSFPLVRYGFLIELLAREVARRLCELSSIRAHGTWLKSPSTMYTGPEYCRVRYQHDQPDYILNLDEIQAYLRWLRRGNTGTHLEMVNAGLEQN